MSSFSLYPSVTNFPSDRPDLLSKFISNEDYQNYPEKSEQATIISSGNKSSIRSNASNLLPLLPWQYKTQGY